MGKHVCMYCIGRLKDIPVESAWGLIVVDGEERGKEQWMT